MSSRAIALVGGIVAFMAVVVAIGVYFWLSGDAGHQRGLVVRNTLAEDVDVTIAGQTARIGPGRREHTFVLRRDDFPSVVRVAYVDGGPLVDREFAYGEFVDAEFRMSIDLTGIYPTASRSPTLTP